MTVEHFEANRRYRAESLIAQIHCLEIAAHLGVVRLQVTPDIPEENKRKMVDGIAKLFEQVAELAEVLNDLAAEAPPQ